MWYNIEVMQKSNSRHFCRSYVFLFLIILGIVVPISCVRGKPTETPAPIPKEKLITTQPPSPTTTITPTPTPTWKTNPYKLLLNLVEIEQIIDAKYREEEAAASKPEETGKGILEHYKRIFFIEDTSLILTKPMMILSIVAVYRTDEEAQSSFKSVQQEQLTSYIKEDQRDVRLNSDLEAQLANMRNPLQKTSITVTKYVKENLVVEIMIVGKTRYYDSFALELARISGKRVE